MSQKTENDRAKLRAERKERALPWSLSPFEHSCTETCGILEEGEVHVKAPEEVPFVDLMQEIAMTTAFASLCNGTPILQWDNVLSYLCYFFFVFFIWVSQVAYSIRFRQADWFHRIMVFAQLSIFAGLSAFTYNFSITAGLYKACPSTASNGPKFTSCKTDYLRVLNAKGISIVMMLSRFVLLLQYIVAFYHAKTKARGSLAIHITSLVFSMGCYFAAFLVMQATIPSSYRAAIDIERWDGIGIYPRYSIAKLVLWYLPLFAEIYAHIAALQTPGFVKYPSKSVYRRSGTAFLIILGAGLDKITSNFQTVVGNAGLRFNGIPLFIAAATIFISYFSMYFGTPGSSRKLGKRRALAWLFSQFLFLAALIVTLQGIATSLAFTNINAAFLNTQAALQPVFDWQANNIGQPVNVSNFSPQNTQLNELGLALEDVAVALDNITQSAYYHQDPAAALLGGELQLKLGIFVQVLNIDAVASDVYSQLNADIQAFMTANFTNPAELAELNNATFYSIYSGIIKSRGSSALWFYPAAGATIMSLAILSMIKGKPADKYEWAVIGARLTVGSGICCLAVLNIGSAKAVFDSSGTMTDSMIWVLVVGRGHLLLALLATIMAPLLAFGHIIAYAANRSYFSFEDIYFEQPKLQRRAEISSKHGRAGLNEPLLWSCELDRLENARSP